MAILLNNVNANTDGEAVKFSGGSGVLLVRGDNYTEGTVKIEGRSLNDPNSRWASLRDSSTTNLLAEYTADTTTKIEGLAVGLEIRATLTGAIAPPENIFVEIIS